MKRFNKAEWIGFVFLLGWIVYLVYLLKSGGIVSYIHPKRIPLMWGTVLGMIVLALYQSSKLFTIPSRQAKTGVYMPIGLILLCGLLTLTSKETDRAVQLRPQSVLSNSTSSAAETEDNSEEAKDAGVTYLEEGEAFIESNPNEIDNAENKVAGADEIFVKDENYTQTLSDIEQNPSQYVGRKIVLEGFVYRDPSFGKNDFVVARMFMICCAADAQITGLMATWDKSNSLNDNQWIKAEGILKTQSYVIEGQESLIPIIHITSAEKLPTPENQYVYY